MKIHNEEVLLQLSLTLASSLDAEVILSRFLSSATLSLGLEAAVVVDCSLQTSTKPLIASHYPPSFAASQFLNDLSHRSYLFELYGPQEALNLDSSMSKGGLKQQSFRLPGFGILFLIGLCAPWDDAFLRSWQSLMYKLADALRACATHKRVLLKNRRLALATSTANVGTWEVNPQSSSITFDKQTAALYGLEKEGELKIDFFYDRVFIDDIPNVKSHFAAVYEHGDRDHAEFSFKIVLPDGSRKKLFSRSSLSVNQRGEKVLIGAVLDITEQEVARTESLYRSKLENIMNSLSMKIISASWEHFDDITNFALREVGEYVGADRAYRIMYDFDACLCDNTHEWCAAGISPEIDNLQRIPIADIPFFVNVHKTGLPFHLQRVSDLPEGHALRAILEPQGVQSLLAIPLMDRRDCLGFIGFDSVRSLRYWTEVDVSLLRFLADLLVNAELKFRREKAIAKASQDLEEARIRAESLARQANSANEAKTRFITTISHEIRTPLHAILGFSDMLLSDGRQEDFLEHVSSIKEAGAALLDLINDVLELSKIESDHTVPQLLDFDFFALLQSCQRMFTPSAGDRGIRLHFNIDDASKGVFQGDQLRIRQVINNLISNAIKFTHTGGVTVNVMPLGPDTEASDGLVRHFKIEVVDSGIGISEASISKIFEPFFQVDDGNGRLFPGAGLGLSIVKKNIELMGGSVAVESHQGEGAKFTIRLPLLLKSAIGNETLLPNAVGTIEPRETPLRILFAEDNVVNQQLARIHLKDLPCILVVVANGEEALQMFKESTFDVILMDCQMPVMDGFNSAHAMREHECHPTRTPIIAVTASAMSDDKANCFAAGMDDILAKPYSKSEFLAKIYQWTNR